MDIELKKTHKFVFDKVKRCVSIHLWIFVGFVFCLSIFLLPNYFTFRSDPNIEKQPIGSILLKSDSCDFENTITVDNETYYFDNILNNLYKFTNYSLTEKPQLFLSGSYFPDFPTTLDGSYFDIDENKRLYYLSSLNSYYANETDIYPEFYDKVKVFYNHQLEKTIELPEIENLFIGGYKVINQCVIFYVSANVNKETELTPYFLYFSLNNKTIEFKKFLLTNPIISMDRSGDELAALSIDGKVSIYATVNENLVLKEEWVIPDFKTKFTGKSKLYITYTQFGGQIVLIHEILDRKDLFLLKKNQKNLIVNQINRKGLIGIIKIKFKGNERFVLVIKQLRQNNIKKNLFLFQN